MTGPDTGPLTGDPSDSRELVEAALKPWGWTCGPDFWRRYHSDPWVFNLVNAVTRIMSRVDLADAVIRKRAWNLPVTEAELNYERSVTDAWPRRPALEDDEEPGR